MNETNEVTFVAIGPNCWGKGHDVSFAAKNCKKELPRSLLKKGKHNIRVYRVAGFNYVNDIDGAINYDAAGAVELIDTQTFTLR